MKSILGIFESRTTAEKAVQGLLATPISPPSIIFLSGEAGKTQVDSLPTTDTERDGMGEAVGGLVEGPSAPAPGYPSVAPLPACLCPASERFLPSDWGRPRCWESAGRLREQLRVKRRNMLRIPASPRTISSSTANC